MVLEGSTSIRDLETQHQVRLPRDEGFETLAGFVMTSCSEFQLPAIRSNSKAAATPSSAWTAIGWRRCASSSWRRYATSSRQWTLKPSAKPRSAA